ncbi:MAG: penicillin-binding transpeptidase domain-containing protein [Eubacteriales bacterium]|nr:penicillin-binding transpeptidase domain-containing protein [Eubacteriales bacterium]MDD4421459.1 penicillin-binding transpeptidase domain-containing protein [Eubacteriales bacterium]
MKSSEKVKKTGRSIVVRAKVTAIIITLLLVMLVTRLANLQLIDAKDYKNTALDQYTHEVKIEAKRGTIYDRNLKQLAVSATVYDVFVSPNDVLSIEQMSIIAYGLSEILGVERSVITEKLQKTSSKYQIIKKAISDAEEHLVRTFITEKELTGIVNLEETTKRYYQYGSLASHILGFTGADNTGLAGIEYTYDEYLSGTDGRVVKAKDAAGDNLPFKYESYIEAEDGLNIVSTIDYTVQSILEKYIKQAYEDRKPNGTVQGIVMDVTNGEILASAIYPNYDPNNYNVLSEVYQAKLLEYATITEGVTEEQIAAKESELLMVMRDNSVATKTYEPGSTFKVITSAMALEEGICDINDTFTCTGSIRIPGYSRPIKCTRTHGTQTFPQALKNSCNPAFVMIGTRVGDTIFKKYFDIFGYTELSGSDFAGEAGSIYYGSTGEKFSNVSLAVYSFGQTFKITPIQHLRAVSTIANGGDLVTPHLVKALVDNDGNTVRTFEYETERQVISEATCDIIRDALINSTKNANVSGYNVISKTGTSQKQDTDADNDYISSCITFAPYEDPQIAIMILVDDPTTNNQIYGSLVAAPVISSVLTEVLPYLGIEPTSSNKVTFTISDYINMDTAQVKSEIESKNLKCVVKGSGATVTGQLPAPGTIIPEGGVIILYTDDEKPENTVRVPDVVGSSPSAANKSITNNNLNIAMTGIFNDNYADCKAISQSPAAGEYVAPGTVITVNFLYGDGGID